MKTVAAAAFAIAFFLLAGRALPQDNSEDVVARFNREVGKWKRNVAAPSYGLMLFHGRVRPVQDPAYFVSSMTNKGILLQGVDVRFFIGKNVTTGGGFYSGIESGIFTYISGLFPGAVSFKDTVTVNDTEVSYSWPGSYQARVNVDGGFVFLMGKYGFRVDTGSPLYGLGFGVEMGAGGGIRSGGGSIFVGDKQNPVAKTDFSGNTQVSLIVDSALEASLRLGRNFRVFGKLGLVFFPLEFVSWDPMRVDQNILNDTFINSNEEYMRYALQRYVVEIDPFAYELRVGFALSFN